MGDKKGQQQAPQTWGWDGDLFTILVRNSDFPKQFDGVEPAIIDRKAVNLQIALVSQSVGRDVVTTGDKDRTVVHGGGPIEILRGKTFAVASMLNVLEGQAWWMRITAEEKPEEGIIRKIELRLGTVRKVENALPAGFVPPAKAIAYLESIRDQVRLVGGCFINPVENMPAKFVSNLVIDQEPKADAEHEVAPMAFEVKDGVVRLLVQGKPKKWVFGDGLHDPAKMSAADAIRVLKLMPSKGSMTSPGGKLRKGKAPHNRTVGD